MCGGYHGSRNMRIEPTSNWRATQLLVPMLQQCLAFLQGASPSALYPRQGCRWISGDKDRKRLEKYDLALVYVLYCWNIVTLPYLVIPLNDLCLPRCTCVACQV